MRFGFETQPTTNAYTRTTVAMVRTGTAAHIDGNVDSDAPALIARSIVIARGPSRSQPGKGWDDKNQAGNEEDKTAGTNRRGEEEYGAYYEQHAADLIDKGVVA